MTSKLNRRWGIGLFLTAGAGLGILWVFLLGGSAPAPNPPDPVSYRPLLSSYKLPDEISYAGQRVPLENWQVHERIEYEFYQFLDDEGENIILAKRTGRCFPLVEQMLAEAGLPDDLKYILLVESKCAPTATSAARAAGPWQFLSSTGRRFDLERNYWKDERRDLERSTEAAIRYLKLLHERFEDWFIVVAAYNAGEERISKSLRDQKVTEYWKLRLNRETMRYVPRIVAVKEIFSKPDQYLGVRAEDLYAPVPVETVTVKITGRHRHLADLAQEHDSYFLELKLLNPELRNNYLPAGTHQIRVPLKANPACPGSCEDPFE